MGMQKPGTVLTDVQMRVKALASVLAEKGMVQQETLDAIVDQYETKVGPHCGAQVVARAWTDPAFKKLLLENGSAAVESMGFGGLEGGHMTVRENTPTIHNMVVCTLCSCYPWATLGLPPVWYKSAPYRSRAVRDPRGLLKEFGVELGSDVEVRVWDSNSDMRYLVLPMRPAGTDKLSAKQLAALVTRDSMIGTALLPPYRR